MEHKSFRYADMALLLFAFLYLAGTAVTGWLIGRDWPATGVAGSLVMPVGGLICWLLALVQLVRIVFRDRRRGRRRVVAAVAVIVVLAMSPVAAALLVAAGYEAGMRHQLRLADFDQVREDCARLIEAHHANARRPVIHMHNPAFKELPESILKLNPVVIRVTPDYVEITRYAMIARRRGIRVVPSGKSYQSQHGEEEIAEGIYLFES